MDVQFICDILSNESQDDGGTGRLSLESQYFLESCLDGTTRIAQKASRLDF